MKHLILVLDGPLQSWGGTAPFWSERPTERMPTLSGIAGLIANALGARRGDPLDGLADAEMHVRADRPGRRVEDYHTIGGHPTGKDKSRGVPRTGKGKHGKPSENAILTRRHFLADAAFTVHWTPGSGLSTHEVAAALRRPRRPLYLGRRSCPPGLPVLLAETDLTADEAFGALPLLAEMEPTRPGDYFAAVAASAPRTTAFQSPGRAGEPGSESRFDVPVTFDPARRWQLSSNRWIRNYTREYDRAQLAGRGRRGANAMLAALQQEEAA